MKTTEVKRIDPNRLEWLLLGVIAIVCAGLSLLQYRWTGQVSQAERARLRSGLSDQVVRLVRAFDGELRDTISALRPDAAELSAEGPAAAHQTRYEQWAASHDRAMLARIGVVVPEAAIVKLYLLDAGGRMTPAGWPSNWAPLRDQFEARLKGSGKTPSPPRDSTLIEVPVFDNTSSQRRRAAELEWMVVDISEDYLRWKTLPRLVAEYLNPGEAAFDMSVSRSGALIYSTRNDGASVAPGADLNVGMFPVNITAPTSGLAGRFRDQPSETRWMLAVRHKTGSLDAVVAAARIRNLFTSFALIALLAGTAWVLVRYTARSRRLADMQFRFAAGISHDLRTPLTAIRGAAFNIADGVVTEPGAVGRYGKLILRNAEELTSMIENVLAFSATLNSGSEAPPEIFAIGDLLEHAAASLAQESEQAGCRIELTVASALPAVAGNSVTLEHAFRNLIGNAIRHAAQGKWIGVSAAPSAGGAGVLVRVCDRGPGVPEAELKRIFDPFYRGERTRAVQVRGTGLGLSLVRETVERHHGFVTAENSAGGGAQFTVRLPAAAEAE